MLGFVIEKLIEQTKESYYDALQDSSESWHKVTGSYAPFVSYTLGIILNAYREFSTRVEYLTTKGLSKPDRIKALIEKKVGKITKQEILDLCPDISAITVQRTLAELVKQGEITKIGGGRYTSYSYNR